MSILLSALGPIYTGIQQNKIAQERAGQYEVQANLAKQESEANARLKEEERTRFIARQKVAFLANGIGIAGTGSVVLEDTFNQFQLEIDAIRRSGVAQSNFLTTEASIQKKTGRSQLVSGYITGLNNAISTAATAAKGAS